MTVSLKCHSNYILQKCLLYTAIWYIELAFSCSVTQIRSSSSILHRQAVQDRVESISILGSNNKVQQRKGIMKNGNIKNAYLQTAGETCIFQELVNTMSFFSKLFPSNTTNLMQDSLQKQLKGNSGSQQRESHPRTTFLLGSVRVADTSTKNPSCFAVTALNDFK